MLFCLECQELGPAPAESWLAWRMCRSWPPSAPDTWRTREGLADSLLPCLDSLLEDLHASHTRGSRHSHPLLTLLRGALHTSTHEDSRAW